MQQLKLALLGSFQVSTDSISLANLRSNKTRALLAYLAIEAGRPHPRAVLAALLWPEASNTAARASLRASLSNLRQTLAPLNDAARQSPCLVVDRQTVQLDINRPNIWLDVVEFDTAWLACEAHPHNGRDDTDDISKMSRCLSCVRRLSAVIELYQGNFLAGLEVVGGETFEEWRLWQQETHHRQALSTLDTLARHHLANSNCEQAQHYARRQLKLEPWLEHAHQQLMQALHLNGERSAALAQYETCRRALQDNLGTEPSAETIALYERIKKGRASARIKRLTAEIELDLDRRTAIEARLEAIDSQYLFGTDRLRQRLREILEAKGGPWLISLEGMGGLGKTTLADRLVRDLISSDHFYDIAWVSAKQQQFQPASGIFEIGRPALNVSVLIDTVLQQLAPNHPQTMSLPEKVRSLKHQFKTTPYLVVIDNLETVADYKALLPIMRQLAKPSKFLLTSRHSLYAHSDVFCTNIKALSRDDAQAFLRHEAQGRGLTPLVRASETQLDRIYQVVGGNPLALKLVVGQLYALPLTKVLSQLEAASDKKVNDLYTYLYWQTWHALSDIGRQGLLAMGLTSARGSTFDHLMAICGLETEILSQALQELTAFSLVEVGGDLEERRYRIHRLTETFLLTQVARWAPPD